MSMTTLSAMATLLGEVERFINAHPDRVTPELRAAFDQFVAVAEEETAVQDQDDCRRCGHRIVKRGGRWVHSTTGGERGCRAASWSRDGTWDNQMDRNWYATPTKGKRD